MKVAEIKNSLLFWGVLSEEALVVLQANLMQGAVVLNCEMRPFGYGIGVNRQALEKARVPYVCITDNMVGGFFYRNQIKKVFIAYKKEQEGGFLCWPGSLYVFKLACMHAVKPEFVKGIDILPARDKDASTIAGKPVISEEKKQFVIAPEEELIPKEEVKW
jgi:methylthioribose-1-phosphate isomerase